MEKLDPIEELGPTEELDPAGELISVNRWPLVLAVFAFFWLTFYLLQPILLPFVLGGLIAYLGDPVVDWLESHKLNRTVAVSIVFIFLTGFMVIAGLIFVPLLLTQVDVLIQKVPYFYQWLTHSLMPWFQQRLSLPPELLPKLDLSSQLADNWQTLGKFMAETTKRITGSGISLLLGIANLALVPVVAFYLMRDWDILVEKALRIIPMAWQKQVATMVSEGDEVVGSFLRGQFIVMCALGFIYGIGLWILGVELALLLGVIAGLASMVPYLGFLVGIISSLIAAYVQFQELGVLLWVALIFGFGQIIESMVLTPILVGDRIGLHPVAVIFALMAGGQIAGFVGVVVALPVAAVITVFARHAIAHYRSTDLYAGTSE
ncbi:MAG: putative PurR-regulated permease PerM [Halioglobus sp.]|jgi:predicted PurR-regulated permease PerM